MFLVSLPHFIYKFNYFKHSSCHTYRSKWDNKPLTTFRAVQGLAPSDSTAGVLHDAQMKVHNIRIQCTQTID